MDQDETHESPQASLAITHEVLEDDAPAPGQRRGAVRVAVLAVLLSAALAGPGRQYLVGSAEEASGEAARRTSHSSAASSLPLETPSPAARSCWSARDLTGSLAPPECPSVPALTLSYCLPRSTTGAALHQWREALDMARLARSER